MTVTGIDISKWDGAWDAEKAKAAGAVFAFIKASQATFSDPQFSANWAKAKSAGLLRGAYHYLDYAKSGREQANYFADLLTATPCELPPVVDYEQARTDNNVLAARTFLRDFVEQLISRGYSPIIYTSSGFWNIYGDKTDAYWSKFPLWIAHYVTAAAPTVPAPWSRWKFWQYTSKGNGALFGTQGLNVDLNHFEGTMSDLLQFAGITPPVPTAPPTVPPPSTLTIEQRLALLEQRIAVLEQKLAPSVPVPAPPTPPPAPSVTLNAICTAAGLNLRSGPTIAYPVVGGLVYGQRIKVLERQNGWAHSDAPAGWCNEKYLNFVS
jgi:GH25 family lysozyme M1 (1,4-beta-N-acetylmuramidase)